MGYPTQETIPQQALPWSMAIALVSLHRMPMKMISELAVWLLSRPQGCSWWSSQQTLRFVVVKRWTIFGAPILRSRPHLHTHIPPPPRYHHTTPHHKKDRVVVVNNSCRVRCPKSFAGPDDAPYRRAPTSTTTKTSMRPPRDVQPLSSRAVFLAAKTRTDPAPATEATSCCTRSHDGAQRPPRSTLR